MYRHWSNWAVVLFFAVILIGACASGNGAALFYVSASSGNDSNDGSASSPWRTLEKAARTLRAGTTVIVMPGTYNERVKVLRSGSSGSPIVFRAQTGGARPILRGFTIVAEHIRVEGFEITHLDSVFPNSDDDDDIAGAGVYLEGSAIEVANNYIHDTARQGVILLGSNNTVRSNTIKAVAHAGIWVHGQNQLVENNDISGIIEHSAKWAKVPSWIDADGVVIEGAGHVIRGNRIHDIFGDDPRNADPHSDCFQITSGENVTIEQNECSIPPSKKRCYQGAMVSGAVRNLTFMNNVVHDMCRGFNIVGSIPITGVSVVNNTFVNLQDAAVELAGDVRGPIVLNNIFANISHPYLLAGPTVQPGNIGNNLAYRTGGRPFPNDLWNVDPKFVNAEAGDFHLRSTSPAIDHGIKLPSVLKDKDGASRPQGRATDIGAFESF